METDTKNFKSDFSGFVWERMQDCEIPCKNQKYKELSDQGKGVFDKIKELLPDEHKKLINEYEELEVAQTAIEAEEAYYLGLRDGLALREIIGTDNK